MNTQIDKCAWRPIENAPRDGSCVLVFPGIWTGVKCSMACFDGNEYASKPIPYWRRFDDMGRVTLSRKNPPTHWMPLPEPPQV